MASFRALLVDDEPVARRILREELEASGIAEVAGEAADGLEALSQIERLRPDVVFLDLQMPGMDGFEVIRDLPDRPPAIVIVTAFDQHALRAFEEGAVDYLLKPVSPERLKVCLERLVGVRSRSAAVNSAAAQRLRQIGETAGAGRPGKIVGKVGEEYHLIAMDQVFAFQAEGDLVWIVTRKQRYLATQTLKVVQAKVGHLHFARVHRNALVNLDQVAKMSPLSSQRWLLTLTNQMEFVVSKRQAKDVQSLLRW